MPTAKYVVSTILQSLGQIIQQRNSFFPKTNYTANKTQLICKIALLVKYCFEQNIFRNVRGNSEVARFDVQQKVLLFIGRFRLCFGVNRILPLPIYHERFPTSFARSTILQVSLF